MEKSKTHSCCLCAKSFRKNERIRSLENYETLYDFVMANKLIHLYLHHTCYMQLYHIKRNVASETTHNQDDQVIMDIDLQKIDVGTQTEFLADNTMDQFATTTSCKAEFNTNPCQPFSTTTSNFAPSISDNSIELPFYRLPNQHKTCSICGKNFSSKKISCQEINQSIRIQYLLDHNIYIPIGNRCCSSHNFDKAVDIQSVEQIKKNKLNYCMIKRDELITILNEMKEELKNKDCKIHALNQNPPLNFDDDEAPMSDSNYHVLTGLTREQFNDLCSEIPPSALRDTDIRTPRTAIACLLVKLRLGLSHQALCTLFSVEDKRKMSRILDSACTAIKRYFVPKHLGFSHIERQKVIDIHTRPLAKILLGDNDPNKCIIILDGTYCYIQKSANNLLQRRTYSLHKGKPLVKPMMIVSSDGYIISVMGPFLADGRNNDAEITKNIIYNNKQGFTDWLHPGDLVLVDRGFRDCIPDLEKFGYKTKMPCFLKKDQSQFTTCEANQTRLVTKIRWVIESANGRVKQWQFFNKIIPNSMIEKIGDYFEIVCAMINCYRPVFIQDTSHDSEIAEKMLKLARETNKIKDYVERMKSKSEKRLKWIAMDAANAISDFPKMNFNKLQELTLGIYQLKQARSYTTEHVSSNGAFMVKVANERPDLIRAQVQSRHKNSTNYDVYVQYNKTNISGWYCTCKNGSRVVGCCGHVASIIYYLAYARYNPKHLQQRASDYYNSITDAQDYSDLSDTNSENSDDDSNILYSLG
ncbi:unnamed protein product [Rotaria sp. Silwood2]|nr:unnamed protein product [Rotaria sp. Silwood2]